MSAQYFPSVGGRRLTGAACAILLLSVGCRPAVAESPIVSPPKGGTVRTDKDPLRQRSAEENIVSGRIVSTDDHRLTLREGEGDSEVETVYRLSPRVRVYSGDREIKLEALPSDARIRMQRVASPEEEVTEIHLVAADDDSAEVLPSRVREDAPDAPMVSTEAVPPVKLGATLETTPDGVAIVRIDDLSPLRDAGLRAGDYIKTAAGTGVATPEGLFRILNRFDGGASVELEVLRGDQDLEFTITLPADHEKVLVDTSANNVPAGRDTEIRFRGARRSTTELMEQILRNQQRQQAQLNYLHQAMQRLAQAAGVDGNVLGVAPFGFGAFGTGVNDGSGGNCFCAIGVNPQGNPVIGFTQNGTAVAVVSSNAAGIPILAETVIATPGRPDVANDGLSNQDQNGDGLPDGPDLDGDGFPPAANENAGANSNCFCPIGTDPNGKPIVGMTRQEIPVAVVGATAQGHPILAETRLVQNGQTGAGAGTEPEVNKPPVGELPQGPKPEPEPIVPFKRTPGKR